MVQPPLYVLVKALDFDFTTEQVWSGKVKYSLADFTRDLENEVKFQFKKTCKRKKEFNRLFKFLNLIIVLKSNGKTNKQIHRITKAPLDLIKMTIETNQENKNSIIYFIYS